MGRKTTVEYDIEGLADLAEQIGAYSAEEAAEARAIKALWVRRGELQREYKAVFAALLAAAPELAARLDALRAEEGRLSDAVEERRYALTTAWHERKVQALKHLFEKYPASVEDRVDELIAARRKARKAAPADFQSNEVRP